MMLLPLTAVAWGALAFGAVYPWAYWPLAALAVASGVAGFIVSRRSATPSGRWFPWALVAVGGAIALQLVPLPLTLVNRISPHAAVLVKQLDPAFAAGLASLHAASVWPRDTWIALALFASLALLCLGASQLLAVSGARRFVEILTGFGALLALVGIVQKSLSDRFLYGVWDIGPWRTPFGPFVNKNHFAGWMLMALPLTLALLVAGIDQGMRGVKSGWRHKVLWFASEEANRLILVAAAAALMATALMLTMSRSGITAFALSTLMTGWVAARTVRGRTRRLVAAASLAVLLLAALLWSGPELVASRFAAADWGEFNNRKGAWADAWSVVRDFPLVGTGVNTYWAASLFYQRHELASFFAQAHNDYLQIAAEGGALVVIPALFCLTAFIADVRGAMMETEHGTTRWLRAGAVTSLMAIAFQETVDFSLQMPGNAALFAIVCGLALHRPAADEAEPADVTHAIDDRALRLVRGSRERRRREDRG